MQQDQQEDYTAVITAAMLWDMLPAAAVVPLCAEAGVTPPDAEGAAYEQAASEKRRSVIGPLLPWIEVLAVIAAEIEGIATIRPAPGTEATAAALAQALAETRDRFEMQAHDIIVPAACAIISVLTERGFLAVTSRGQAATLDAFTGN